MGKHSTPRAGLIRRALFGGLSLTMVAGGAAYASLAKDVTVVVDGQSTTVTTYATDVEDALADAEVQTEGRDLVTPGLSSQVRDGDTVQVTYARPLEVTIDGVEQTRWVTALTVDEALAQLGLADHAVVASRDQRLPLSGSEVDLSAPKPVTIVVDGGQQQIVSSGPSVDDVLTDAGVTLGAEDIVDPAGATTVTAGMTVTVTRQSTGTHVEQRPIPHGTVQQPDPGTYIGLTTVLTQGTDGVQNVTVQTVTVNGVVAGTTDLSSEVVTAPVDTIVSVGAKEFPANVNALNWDGLAKCESTNNPAAVSSTGKYHGLYQFSVDTWQRMGGSGLPSQATPEEQTARAKMLYLAAGRGQWPVCGAHL